MPQMLIMPISVSRRRGAEAFPPLRQASKQERLASEQAQGTEPPSGRHLNVVDQRLIDVRNASISTLEIMLFQRPGKHPRAELPPLALSTLSPRTFHIWHLLVLVGLQTATEVEASERFQEGKAAVL